MDSQDIINPYDRIELLVAGVKLTARPIEFELNSDKNPIKATKYETTCPKCGNLIQFFGVMKSIECTSCGTTEAKAVESRVLIRQGVVTKRKSSNQTQRDCPFIDPIEAGVFTINTPDK